VDSTQVLLCALQVSEVDLSASSTIAGWMGVAIGVLSLIFVVGSIPITEFT
jgi:hypothetical protein